MHSSKTRSIIGIHVLATRLESFKGNKQKCKRLAIYLLPTSFLKKYTNLIVVCKINVQVVTAFVFRINILYDNYKDL